MEVPPQPAKGEAGRWKVQSQLGPQVGHCPPNKKSRLHIPKPVSKPDLGSAFLHHVLASLPSLSSGVVGVSVFPNFPYVTVRVTMAAAPLPLAVWYLFSGL